MAQKPSGIIAVTAHIREDRFYCIDDQGQTWVTEHDGGMTMVPRESIPEGTPQWRGLWRDGDIPGLLYFAAGEGGIWKSVDGFATEGGYFPLRQSGVDGSPSNAIHRRVGLHGKLHDAPTPIAEGNVYVVGEDYIAVRVGKNNWEQISKPSIGEQPNIRLMINGTGNSNILYLLSNFGHFAKSENGGQSWQLIPLGFSGMDVAGAWISPGLDELTVYAGGSNGIHRTVDGGQSWTQLRSGHLYQVRDFGARKWFGGFVDSRWVHYTDNDDFTTYESTGFSGAAGGLGGRFAVSSEAINTVYHWRQNPGTDFERWRVGDGSASSSSVSIKPSQIAGGTVRWAEASGTGTVICLGTFDSGSYAFRSDNQGSSWTQILGPSEINGLRYEGPQVTFNPIAPTEWWIVEGNNTSRRVWHSTDNGMTWEDEICDVDLGFRKQIVVVGSS